MLELAMKPIYTEQLIELYTSIWGNEYYKFFITSPIFNIELAIPDKNTKYRHEFVSVDKFGDIIGVISYSIDRSTGNCHTLFICNFDNVRNEISDSDKRKRSVIFGRDIKKAINDLFLTFNFNKLEFYVVVGNPVEKTYDKLVQRYGGKVVEIKKQDVRLWDNKLYDTKWYKILKSSYDKDGSCDINYHEEEVEWLDVY